MDSLGEPSVVELGAPAGGLESGAGRGAEGDGPPVEIPLGAELCNSLCRRSRRRFRDMQAEFPASLTLDRSREVLCVQGAPSVAKAVERYLETLWGPRKDLTAAAWAELMRTRKAVDCSQALVIKIQESSGARVHIERDVLAVRLFGSKTSVDVADKLLDELIALCEEVVLPMPNSGLPISVELQHIAEDCGVTFRIEHGCIATLGLKESVAKAVERLADIIPTGDLGGGDASSAGAERHPLAESAGAPPSVEAHAPQEVGAAVEMGAANPGGVPVPRAADPPRCVRFCAECGTARGDGARARFCSECGVRYPDAVPPPEGAGGLAYAYPMPLVPGMMPMMMPNPAMMMPSGMMPMCYPPGMACPPAGAMVQLPSQGHDGSENAAYIPQP